MRTYRVMMYKISDSKLKAYQHEVNEKGQDIIKEYQINKIKRHTDWYNVCIKKNARTGLEYIAWKPGQKPQGERALDINNSIYSFRDERLGHIGQQTSISLQVLTEDKQSANTVIKQIVNYLGIKNNIEIKTRFISSDGAGNICKVLNTYVNKAIPCIVVMDSGVVQDKIGEVDDIKRNISELILHGHRNIICIKPLAIEELCLTYSGLRHDIKGISNYNTSILNKIDKAMRDKDLQKIQEYDINTRSYKVCGIVLTGDRSEYISDYKRIDQAERFLADRLAQITKDRPYEFIKRAQICWYENCRYCNSDNRCIMEVKKGSEAERVAYCNKTRLNVIKAEDIVRNQLFQVIFDQINLLTIKNKSQLYTDISILKDITVGWYNVKHTKTFE